MTMGQAVLCRKVGIVGENPFTDNQLEAIKTAIMAVIATRPSNTPPEFHGIQNRNGLLVATMANPESETWMYNQQEAIAAASGLSLRVVSEKDIPKTAIFKAFFSHSSGNTNEEILRLLGSQFRDFLLPTEEWIVVRRIVRDDSVILFMAIDVASADIIRDCKGSLPYRFGHAKFLHSNAAAAEAEPSLPVDGTGPTPDEARAKPPPKVVIPVAAPAPVKPSPGAETPAPIPIAKGGRRNKKKDVTLPPSQSTLPGIVKGMKTRSNLKSDGQ